MCVACLNVSTQPCAHRWYQLVRPCHPANHLANCPEKLQLQGWESRLESCPFCNSNSDSPVHHSTHRLFGSTSSSSSDASITSSTQSTTAAEAVSPRRPMPADATPSLSPLSRHSSVSSMESERSRGQRHREMNERLAIYLSVPPHAVLPSARKNYPTYPQLLPGPALPASVEVDAGSECDGQQSEALFSGTPLSRGTGLLGRKWKRMSRGLRPGFGSSSG